MPVLGTDCAATGTSMQSYPHIKLQRWTDNTTSGAATDVLGLTVGMKWKALRKKWAQSDVPAWCVSRTDPLPPPRVHQKPACLGYCSQGAHSPPSQLPEGRRGDGAHSNLPAAQALAACCVARCSRQGGCLLATGMGPGCQERGGGTHSGAGRYHTNKGLCAGVHNEEGTQAELSSTCAARGSSTPCRHQCPC